jgi:hypothetical protein
MNGLKYFIVFVFLTTIVPGTLSAQNYYLEDDNTFKGMVTFGSNFSQIDGDNYAGYSKAGINGGAGVFTKIGKELAVGLELLYSRKGSKSIVLKAATNKAFDIISYKAILNYIDIPLQLYYIDGRKDQFGAGFSYSRLINQSETFDTNPPQKLQSSDYPFKKSDYCFIASANAHIVKGIYVTARFQYSLVSIRGNVPPGFGRTEQYNHMWTIRLMYMFNQ